MSEQLNSLEVPDPSKPIQSEAIKEVESPQDDKFNESFQRIAKQENHIKEQRKQIEEARKAFEVDKLDVEKYRTLQRLKNEDPLEILSHFGITFDEVQRKAIEKARPGDPVAKKALEAVEQLKSELRDRDEKLAKEHKSKLEVQLMSNIDKEIKDGEHDVIEKLGMQSMVREKMEEIYEKTGNIDYKSACEAVTAHIVGLYNKISDSKHIRGSQKEVPKKLEEISGEKKENVSLSNKMTQTSISTDRPMTDAERIKAAARIMDSFGK